MKNNQIEFNIEKQKSIIIKQRYENYLKQNLNNEKTALLNELKITFEKDGRSDIEIIELACNTFKYLFANNYEYAERDLKSLINIKKNNPYFIMIKDNYSHFDEMGYIAIDEIYNIDTFNHELTHAIHWYATQERIPQEFLNETHQINEENYKQFIKQYIEQATNIKEKLKKENIDFFNKDETDTNNKQENNSKEQINHSKNNIIVEEYKKYYNELAIQELLILLQEDYKNSIIDIVDALTNGKVYEQGIIIDNTMYRLGHGKEYYNNSRKIFKEIIAQYNEIIKSSYKEQALKTLENIVGKELIKLLEKFNEELVIQPLENKKTRTI